MNVLVDYHHLDLYHSLQFLFEKRLGWNLYRPIGMDWFTKGYWKIAEPYNNYPGTVMQFLDINNQTFDEFKNLNGGNYVENGIYYIYDPRSKMYQKAITFDKFQELDIDIVISSYEPHDVCYAELIKTYKPKAKHISQMGNIFQKTEVNNVMCSTIPYPIPEGKNVVFYHQEFDTSIFTFKTPVQSKKIHSYVHLFDSHPDNVILYSLEDMMPDWKFKMYGMSNRDGTIAGRENIAESMHESQFVWHTKAGGDGYGHIIHNVFSCGRPAIVRRAYYAGQLAEKLFEDGKTCLEIDNLGPQQIADKILLYADPEEHNTMCENAYLRFKEVVNFDEEEQKIREFLSRLQ